MMLQRVEVLTLDSSAYYEYACKQAGIRVAYCADIDTSTKRNVSCAVLPSSSFRRAGSCSPGTCTRIRFAPCRWIKAVTARLPAAR